MCSRNQLISQKNHIRTAPDAIIEFQKKIVRGGHIVFGPSNCWDPYGSTTTFPQTAVPTALTRENLVDRLV